MTNHDDTAGQPTSEEIIDLFEALLKKYDALPKDVRQRIDQAGLKARTRSQIPGTRRRPSLFDNMSCRRESDMYIVDPTNPEGELLNDFLHGWKPEPYTSAYLPGFDDRGEGFPLLPIDDRYNKPLGEESQNGSSFGTDQESLFLPWPPERLGDSGEGFHTSTAHIPSSELRTAIDATTDAPSDADKEENPED